MKTICLTNYEAEQAASLPVDGELVIVREMKKQPPEGYELSLICTHKNITEAHFLKRNPQRLGRKKYICPYAISQRIKVRETWGLDTYFDTKKGHQWEYVYKASMTVGQIRKYLAKDHHFFSPATMPAEAGKTQLVLDGVDCKEIDGKWNWIYQMRMV